MRSPVRLVMRKGTKYQSFVKALIKSAFIQEKMTVTQKMLEKRKEGR